MEIGTRIGPYEIRQALGQGGMAQVWKAWHLRLHRFEALKIPSPRLAEVAGKSASLSQATSQGARGEAEAEWPGGERAFVARFLHEARIAASLRHPHIATIYGVSEGDAPQPFFAMELVEGGDLAALIQARGRLSVDEALPILEAIASALDYAHAQGVIHRDIKPANVLLEARPQPWSPWSPKVVDFGIAHAARARSTPQTQSDEDEAEHTALSSKEGPEGGVAGTPEYMSPEQAGSGEKVGPASDIYSMGVVAYEMLCGRPPFSAQQDTSPVSILAQHLSELPPRPSAWHSDLPPALDDALGWALAKSPLQRPASGAQFVHALRVAAQGLGGALPAPADFAPLEAAPSQDAPSHDAQEAAASSASPASTYTAPNSLTIVALPAQALPAQALPAQALPAQALPAQALPAQALPAQALPAQAPGATKLARKNAAPRWLLLASVAGGLCLGAALAAARLSHTEPDELPASALEAPVTAGPDVVEETAPAPESAPEPAALPTLLPKAPATALPAITPAITPGALPTALPNAAPTAGAAPQVGGSENGAPGGALSGAPDEGPRRAQAESTAQQARQVKIEVIDNLLLLRKRQEQELLRPEEATASRRKLLARLGQALSLCEDALELDADNETAWEQKAALLFLMGRFEDALAAARQGLQKFPDNRDLQDARDKARQRLSRAAQRGT